MGLSPSWGGVLIDDQGRVLLRKVAGGYGGMVWTFAEGGAEAGETPEQAALREVREETGWTARIRCEIPGEHRGSTTRNRYFLMAPVAEVGSPDTETEATRWVEYDAARRLLAKSSNSTARTRDLVVLELAIQIDRGRSEDSVPSG